MENTAPVLASGNRDSTENHLMANPYEATTLQVCQTSESSHSCLRASPPSLIAIVVRLKFIPLGRKIDPRHTTQMAVRRRRDQCSRFESAL